MSTESKPAEGSISPANAAPPLTSAEWHVLQFEATAVSLPLILKLGAHHGAWPMPRDRSTCPCCGERKEATA